MTFEEIVDQAPAMLHRRGREAYRTLKRQFNLDDEAFEDLKAEPIDAQRVPAEEDGNVRVWTGGTASSPTPGTASHGTPRTYMPPYRAEALLQTLVGDDPALQSLKSLRMARTEGYPCLLEEGMRTLVESQELLDERRACRLTQDLSRVQVPATVQADAGRDQPCGTTGAQQHVIRRRPTRP